jgi:hypothetical protein
MQEVIVLKKKSTTRFILPEKISMLRNKFGWLNELGSWIT